MKLKPLLYLFILITIIISIFVWKYNSLDQLKVVFLDIGQGDSILIKAPDGQVVLIDGGPDKTVLSELSKYLPWWDKHIDLMILTHPHADHATGLNYVLDDYQVDRIMATGVSHTASSYISWWEQANNMDNLIIADKPMSVNLGDCDLNILYPDFSILNQAVDNLNNTSIVSKLVCGQTKWLFAGDIEEETEQYLLDSNTDLSADVLKVAHQGSKTSSTLEFLQAVDPDIAVIIVGKNSFGHPSPLILNRLERIAEKILRTDRDGSVELISNGQEIW
ncbi:MAG: MBL fold metallo-hydrolase [bacterium]